MASLKIKEKIMDINTEIEITREKLYKSIDDYGRQHINTIEINSELDRLVNKAMKEQCPRCGLNKKKCECLITKEVLN
jgi:hypothetical protein